MRQWTVDAFASGPFKGNPACVVEPTAAWRDAGWMQALAAENNQAETAYLLTTDDPARFGLRWFTPALEVPLCGHATLASAWVILERVQPERAAVTFETRRSGRLTVSRTAGGLTMDFPANPPTPAPAPDGLAAILGAPPQAVLTTARQYIAVLATAGEVRDLAPDLAGIAALDRRGVVVTAAGDGGYDCVSRYFAPRDGIPEDPVTGGVHCALAPYWCARLGKDEIRAFQASARGGEITCRHRGDRVELQGGCVPYLQGTIEIGP